MTDTMKAETDRLVTELIALGPYEGWTFSYEYPGFFCYSRADLPFSVFFTPDWEGDEEMPIEVQDDIGSTLAEYSTRLPLPAEGRTGQKIFDLVRPTLLTLLTITLPARPSFELRVSLTEAEIAALSNALAHVHVRMLDDEMTVIGEMSVIGKVLAAARKALP